VVRVAERLSAEREVTMKAIFRVILALVLLAIIIGYLMLLGNAAYTLDVSVRLLPIPASVVGLLALVGIFILVWRSRRKGRRV
jgi:membrane protein implicated in regulation of membrane protease activity